MSGIGGSSNENLVTKTQVKQMINANNIKTQNYSDGGSANTLTTTGTYTDLTALAPGTGQNLRNGSAIEVFEADIFISFVLGDTTNLCRIVVFEWFPSSTSDTPTDTELFFGGTGNRWIAPFQGVRPSRFKILHDKIFNLDVAHVQVHEAMTLKLKVNSSFDNSVNTGKNHLYVCLVSDSSAIPHPGYILNYQLHYLM